MHTQFTVAIVGRPNVGKSRLFNRLVGERVSIVHDMPGVTRDTITRDVERDGYTLVDTGGMGLVAGMSDTPEALVSAVEEQIAFSISAADLILFVVDGREGLVPLDIEMADTIRKSSKPVALVVNKVDKADSSIDVNEHYSLGLGEPKLVSAEHDRGISGLTMAILEKRKKRRSLAYSMF